MTALSFENVVLSVRGQPLFEPLSARVGAGDILCIVGPSGAGKSTLLKFACGLLPDDVDARGRVSLGQEDLTTQPAAQRRLGVLFQDALLFPHLSVAQNIAFGQTAQGSGSRAARRRQVDEALASVDLAGYGPRDPATLSGGQRARVALLRVLLSQPRALLLDEPFAALDAGARDRVRALVLSRAREHRLPTVLVTHDKDDVTAAGGNAVTLVANAGEH